MTIQYLGLQICIFLVDPRQDPGSQIITWTLFSMRRLSLARGTRRERARRAWSTLSYESLRTSCTGSLTTVAVALPLLSSPYISSLTYFGEHCRCSRRFKEKYELSNSVFPELLSELCTIRRRGSPHIISTLKYPVASFNSPAPF